jgi:hypothetical protein
MNIKYIALISLAFVAPTASIVAFSTKLDALENAKRTVEGTREEAKQSPTKSRAELIDEKKEALRTCLEAGWVKRVWISGDIDCSTLKIEYDVAKNIFRAPFKQHVEEGCKAKDMLDENMQSALHNLPLIGDALKNYRYASAFRNDKNLTDTLLLSEGSQAIINALEERNISIFSNANGRIIKENCFLNNNLPTAKIAESAMREKLNHNALRSDGTIITSQQIDTAKETLIKTINS